MHEAADHPTYAQLRRLLREADTLGSVNALLGWDQETYMPPAASAARSEQHALLSTLRHERIASPRLGDALAECERDASLTGEPEIAACLREVRRDHDLATKVPGELVAELARTGSLAQDAWKGARAASDFAAFRPWLEKMLNLSRRKAECLSGGKGEAYDALLDLYEPGAKADEVAAVFGPLRDKLSTLVDELTNGGRAPDDSVAKLPIEPARQHEFGKLVLAAMGFDFGAGRLDTTTHPFCSGMAAGDTRLTTRYTEQHFTDALYSTMHEGGHGLYEQGLPKSDPLKAGTPLAEAVSLGIHESQSRMWENFVGRSRPFWEWALPIARDRFGPVFGPVTVDQVHAAVNRVAPSFVRVEADEGTYNLHVMLRFDLERALIGGQLAVSDLPGEWNARFKKLLGLDVPDDRRGCLQDVHWSFGLIGYFPTYTLGNLYAAQLWETINAEIPDLDAYMRAGEFLPLRDWLRDRIHRHGRHYRAGELCRAVTGKDLQPEPLLRHLSGKLRPVHGL